MKTKIIKLSDIVIDAGTQQRVTPTDAVIDEYCEAIKCGAKFPPITVFSNGVEYYLVDGFHRYFANKKAGGIDEIEAEVHEGTKRDAILHSASVNGTHGLRLTNQDKRKHVLVLLNDEEWKYWTDSAIAKHCKVTQPFVSKIRKEIITVIISPLKPAPILETEIEEIAKPASETQLTEQQKSDHPEFNESELMAEIAGEFDPVAEYEIVKNENESLKKIINADDQLAAAMAENKRLTELCRVLEERMRGYQSSENEAVRKARMWKEKFDKLERQVKVAGLVEF